MERTRVAESGALVLRGEPGIGKTALLDAAQRDAHGMRVLRASGFEADRELAWAGLSALLTPVLDLVQAVPQPQCDALARALGLASPRPFDRFAAYGGTLGLLAAAAETEPVLVLVDDLHWLDVSSIQALAFTARRLGHEGVAMLFAAREDEPAAADLAGIPELRVAGVDVEATARIVGERSGHPVADAVAQRLHQATGGNPLALAELSSLLSPGQLVGAEPLDEPLPAGSAGERAFGRRIASLPARTRQALAVAAADATVVVGTLGRALEDLGLDLGRLEAAEATGIVALAAERCVFQHPLARAAAYHMATARERRAAHAALARALESPADRARAAWHRAAAAVGPDGGLANELEAVAVEARSRGAPAEAGRALEAAARLTPEQGERTQRLVAAAQDLLVAGRGEAADALFDAALAESADNPLLRAEIERTRAGLQMLSASPLVVRSRVLREAERVRPVDQTRAIAHTLDATFLTGTAGHVREELRLAEEAFSQAQQLGGQLELLASYYLGAALILNGRPAEGIVLLERVEDALEGQAAFTNPVMTMAFAQTYLWLDEKLERGRAILAALLDRARREGAAAALPYVLACQAEADFRLGDWTSAYAAATESVALAEDIGQINELSHSLARLAHVEAGLGREHDSRTHGERALEIAERLQTGSVWTLAGTALGLLELGIGRFEAATERLEATGRYALEVGLREPAVAPWAQDLAEAYILLGDRERALRTLATLDEQARLTGGRQAGAAVARCRGLVSEDVDEAEALFAGAVVLHDKGPENPFERARTELCHGERRRRAGRRSEARALLHRALDAFNRLGAEPWAQRARHQLAATGERQRPRSPVPAHRLTPRELQVAVAIAGGSTNREAAAALFLSPKTVEAQLTNIYRKLGIRSRTELARTLRGAPTRQPPL